MLRRKGAYRHGRMPTTVRAVAFAPVGIPALVLEPLAGDLPVRCELVRPRFAHAYRVVGANGRRLLDEGSVARTFQRSLAGKTGIRLENAAAELMLTACPDAASSDWARFTAWAARRAQPLDPRLVGELGRFYAARLNAALSQLPRAMAA